MDHNTRPLKGSKLPELLGTPVSFAHVVGLVLAICCSDYSSEEEELRRVQRAIAEGRLEEDEYARQPRLFENVEEAVASFPEQAVMVVADDFDVGNVDAGKLKKKKPSEPERWINRFEPWPFCIYFGRLNSVQSFGGVVARFCNARATFGGPQDQTIPYGHAIFLDWLQRRRANVCLSSV